MTADEFESNSPLSPIFAEALNDSIYLYERGYPHKRTIELVGNRYRLSSVQRSILRRGAVPPSIAAERKTKQVSPAGIRAELLSIDSCNLIAVIGNYLSGCFVYRACDGIIRDAAESNGVFRSSERRRRAVRLIVTAMAKLDPGPLHFYIDEPHPHSRDLAGELREALRAAGLSGEIKLVRSADRVLKNAGGILVSGDSEIIDAVRKVFDLASFVLETEFLADLPDLGVFPQP